MVTFDENSKYKDFPKFRGKKDIYDAIDAKYDAARGKQYEAEMQQGDLASNEGGQGTFKNRPSSFNPTPYFSTNSDIEDDLDLDRDEIDSEMYERLVNGLSIDEATPKADLYVDSVENPDVRIRLESIADELLMEDNKVQGYENYGQASNLPNEELYGDNKALLFDKNQKKGEPDLYLTNDELRDVENTRLLHLTQEYMDSDGNIRNKGEGHDTYDDKMNEFTNKALDNVGKGYNNMPDNKIDGYYDKVDSSSNLQRGMDEALLSADLDLYDELREERDALLVDIDSYGDIKEGVPLTGDFDGDTHNKGKNNSLYDDGGPNKYRDKASGSTRDFDGSLYDDGGPNKYRDKASGFKTLEEQGYDSSMSRSKPKKGMLYGGHVPEVYEVTNKNSETIRKATSLDEGAGFDAEYESSVNKLEDEYVNTSPPEPDFEEEIEDDGPEM